MTGVGIVFRGVRVGSLQELQGFRLHLQVLRWV
jgi:hypothetical protein